MGGPEYNPADEQPIDREEWEAAMAVACLKCGKPIHFTEGTCPHCGYVEFK